MDVVSDMSLKNPIQNQSGSMIIGALIAAAVLGGAILTIVTLTEVPRNDAQIANLSISATILRSNIKAVIENGAAWNIAKANSVGAGACNPNLACVNELTDCSAFLGPGAGPRSTTERPITCLYDPSGLLLFDERIATNGFDENGNPCNTYSSTVGNLFCPFRVAIRFVVEDCQVGDCTAKPVSLVVRFTYRGPDRLPLNMTSYGFVSRMPGSP